jgi:glycosyltransferase involved in cell wall biosynthesis
MHSFPKISIIMSVYNGEKYLHEAVDSILNQTFEDFEFIINDDGSTDRTANILDEFTDHRIIRLKNKKNIGLAASLNKEIAMACGEYLARMDADDIALPDRFSKQIAYLQDHPSVGVLGSHMLITNQTGETTDSYQVPCSNGMIVWKLIFGNPIAHPSVMFRREIIVASGGYDAELPASQDKDLWVRLIDKTKFANLNESLVKYRRHPEAVWARQPGLAHQISQKLGRQLASRFLDEDIPETVWSLVDCSQNDQCVLSVAEMEVAASLIYRLQMAFISQMELDQDERDEIQMDMFRRIIAIGRRDGRVPNDELARAYWYRVLPAPIWNSARTMVRFGRALKKGFCSVKASARG